MISRFRRFAMIAALLWSTCASTHAADTLTRVTLKDSEGKSQVVEGKVVVEAVDKSFLLLGRDGRMWSILPDQVTEKSTTDEEFAPLSSDELAESLKVEFGNGFETYPTKHYLICSNTDKKYAQWCGILFERLMTAFRSQWRNSKVEMHDPEMPLVAIVFADRKEFADYATRDHGPGTANAQGYYSIRSNRIVLYDLTTELKGGSRGADVGERLEASLSNVATVVHEATHQIAFNCGMHTRFAENPLWLLEGMAMYFETPDVRSPAGWKTLGKKNPVRLRAFADYVNQGRPADSLETMITSDKRFTEPETAVQAYGESWSLTYFLIKTRRKQYNDYLQLLAKKKPMMFGKPEDRLAEFRSVFGEDLEKLDREFVRYMKRL